MTDFPKDIYTEAEDVDPDTLANLGPLRRLAGSWEGLKGSDVAPKEEGPDRRAFMERMVFDPIDPQSNGPQTLYGLRYHIHITTQEEDITFHDQVGYWLWEPATGLVMQTLTIPRGQTAMASCIAKPDDNKLVLTATRGSTEYGICSTAFLEYAFRTDSYRFELTFLGEDKWSYTQHTMLKIPGQDDLFDHHDHNVLTRTAPPKPNPLMQIIKARGA